MALSRFVYLIMLALLFCSVIAQSPTPSPVSSPKKSPSSTPTPISSPHTISAPSPSEVPSATTLSPATVESPPSPSALSPNASPTSISEPPAGAPGPAENSAVRFGAAGSVAVGVLMVAMVL
ncbi:hypothetical protein ES319_D02G229400v1 [Gossypium barbadense]|uniref:Arabinogalactan protein n=2 Tax=Gossypium TaxID=3633 RepID=A0A5J5SJU8_GOSBA|nr:hypothetical protein ES319_D02G229400v1 [Gossypium barbadense]PPD79893.1 hypothetical protein GOBAR_DD23188 [Gossypium barbadense]TYG80809.1 hypothetical protein ES288_D02G245800v1 [Gossypium darwinii]